jgi:transposase
VRAYSQDLRERVLGALARGERPTHIARRYEVSRLWVYQVRKRWEKAASAGALRCLTHACCWEVAISR